MRIAIFRKAHFNAAHRLHNPNWSEEKNKEVFGKCNNANYHGHNYELEVKVVGEVNPETGYLMDLKDLKDIIEEHVEDKLDHKNLNVDIEYFQDVNPSVENISVVVFDWIKNSLAEAKFDANLVAVKVFETPKTWAEYRG